MSDRRLTPKQEAFVRWYLATGNATHSAIKAGYSAPTAAMQGSQLLKIDIVQKAIEAGTTETRAETKITKEWVIGRTLKAIDDALEDRAHSPLSRNLELISKLHGFVVERKEVRRVKKWSDLSEEELDALAEDKGDER